MSCGLICQDIYGEGLDAVFQLLTIIAARNEYPYAHNSSPAKPEIELIDILAGDTAQLQTHIKDYLIDFHDSKWSCETVIDNLSKYNLSIQSKIRIKTKIYAITELERDYINDEYKVKAWLLS
jgi:hypothetical protein